MNKKQSLRKTADEMWKFACIKHWGQDCVCGKPAVQVHHFFPKGLFPSTRYSIDNGVPICMKCHFFHHHRGSPEVHQMIIGKRGQNWYDTLRAEGQKHITWTVKYYEDNIKRLQEYLENNLEK